MKDYHHHYEDVPPRQGLFFFVLLAFLSAMFGVIFSNSLPLMYFFWEVTTLCSFVLIGYTRTPEATNNAFRALVLNLVGGVGFAGAVVYFAGTRGVVEINRLLADGMSVGLPALPLALLCLAGVTKSAQMPFSGWLLGAMVAPTPTSALLHSSTMVKAGVFLLLRFAPVLRGTSTGNALALVGGLTFLIGSLVNIPEKNAKKLLAYSTVANLGLIVLCAGVGTPEALWAGMFLVLFHAVAKSLLFLLVGSVENRIHSKEIESMDALVVRMPKLAFLFAIGITAMFVAPFGVVLSKWAVLRMLATYGGLMGASLLLMVAFGSSATIFYWTKLLGKLATVGRRPADELQLESGVSTDEWIAEGSHAVLSLLVCVCIPVISAWLVEPYVAFAIPEGYRLQSGIGIITIALVITISLIPGVLALAASRKAGLRSQSAYFSGRNVTDDHQFAGGMGKQWEAGFRNYYLETLFPERRLIWAGYVAASITLVAMFVGAGN